MLYKMNYPKILVVFLILIMPLPCLAISIDLSVAGSYNSFIFGDFTANSSDTEGRLAVGGNAYLNHYSVGDKLDPSTAGDVLVVGGDLTYEEGRVYYGDVRVGGSAAGVSASVRSGIDHDGATLTEGGDLPFDFTAEQAYLTGLSAELSGLTANGSSYMQWGGLNLTGDKTSDLQIFNLDGLDLLDAHTFNFDTAGIADGATVVFNVSGTTAGLTNMDLGALKNISSNVLFNFYEAETLQLSGIGVEGSILAPLAYVDNPMGVIEGTIIAESWNGMMQQNHNPFTPYNPTPEPATLFLLGFGVIGLAVARRRKSAA